MLAYLIPALLVKDDLSFFFAKFHDISKQRFPVSFSPVLRENRNIRNLCIIHDNPNAAIPNRLTIFFNEEIMAVLVMENFIDKRLFFQGAVNECTSIVYTSGMSSTVILRISTVLRLFLSFKPFHFRFCQTNIIRNKLMDIFSRAVCPQKCEH